jgi:hypothetical protein
MNFLSVLVFPQNTIVILIAEIVIFNIKIQLSNTEILQSSIEG